MKLIILYYYLAKCVYVCALVNIEIENVYIDALIQRYKSIEENIWQLIRENRLVKPNIAVDKIISEHQLFFSDRGLESLMLNDFRLKFQFFYETKSFKNCTQEDRLLKLFDELQIPNYINEKLITDSQLYCVDRVTFYYRKKAKKLNQLFDVILKVIEKPYFTSTGVFK